MRLTDGLLKLARKMKEMFRRGVHPESLNSVNNVHLLIIDPQNNFYLCPSSFDFSLPVLLMTNGCNLWQPLPPFPQDQY